MSGSLFDGRGTRKYLTASERLAFAGAASQADRDVAAFCLTLVLTGARISEVLALTPERVDLANRTLVFETLKRRKRGVFRAIPVPKLLVEWLVDLGRPANSRLFPWCRTTAWMLVKSVMRDAGIVEALCKPKALRHSFAVYAGQTHVPLNVVQRWLGHARIETTAIYADALGAEERNLARRTWSFLNRRLLPTYRIKESRAPFRSRRSGKD